MAKIITNKYDIPKYAQKKIKNFKELTNNQAIFEYELINLKRRAKRIDPRGNTVFEDIIRPRTVYKKDIEQLSRLKGKELREVVESTLASDYADEYKLAKEFFDKIVDQIERERDLNIVANSSYRSGRSRSSASRVWINDNVNRGANKLLNLINSLRSSPEAELNFYKSLGQTKLAMIQDAVSEYMAGLYYQTVETLDSYMQQSRIYKLLSSTPISMSDAKSFDNSGDNSEEEETDEE